MKLQKGILSISMIIIIFIIVFDNKSFKYIENSVKIENIKNSSSYDRIKACVFILCRNSDLGELKKTLKSFEQRFNSKYNYDYVILNNEKFNDNFKTSIKKLTNATVKFGVVPPEHWSYPSFIDQERSKAEALIKKGKMKNDASYRFMCRYYSEFFFRHPLVQEYEHYWRLDAGHSEYLCNINFDPFKFMKENDFFYGFNMITTEAFITIKTLWTETTQFLKNNPDYIIENSNHINFVKDSSNNYNLCMFNNNFEIASFKLWRNEKYLKYFEHLEKAGGFFYERWSDAPIHSIAVAMMLPKSKVYYFENIGYRHYSSVNCPLAHDYMMNCSCDLKGVTYKFSNCLKNWFDS